MTGTCAREADMAHAAVPALDRTAPLDMTAAAPSMTLLARFMPVSRLLNSIYSHGMPAPTSSASIPLPSYNGLESATTTLNFVPFAAACFSVLSTVDDRAYVRMMSPLLILSAAMPARTCCAPEILSWANAATNCRSSARASSLDSDDWVARWPSSAFMDLITFPTAGERGRHRTRNDTMFLTTSVNSLVNDCPSDSSKDATTSSIMRRNARLRLLVPRSDPSCI
mmetsp:Transcript_12332/g.35150  ORF Transcript_12332/g.35150 Transcript_12332/m.35150 type:complete len:225 (+) Transcript_12332:2516-3190(+)